MGGGGGGGGGERGDRSGLDPRSLHTCFQLTVDGERVKETTIRQTARITLTPLNKTETHLPPPGKNLISDSVQRGVSVTRHLINGKMAVPAAIGVAAIAVLYAGKRYLQGPKCNSKRGLDGKTVVITGGNTGIGKETAVDLARRGARVIIGCRNLLKGKEALNEIKERSGNSNVFLEELDLASLKSVRTFADKILNRESRLDVLINNAGVMMCPYQKTEDGFEMQFGTNHLGHFLLTMLLLDRLKRSQPSRIINVSSSAHRMGSDKINFADINFEKSYDRWAAYYNSKLANVLFTRELSKRLEGTHVTVNALHPGVVTTELQRHMFLSSSLFYPIRWYMFKTAEQGAQTSIYCAVSEEMEGVSGKYLRDCAIVKESKGAQDDEAAKKLWDLSMNMVGLEK